MTFCEVVVAEIIGGIVSGLVVALGAYFILDRILIRKAKVRLYIEPNEPVLDKNREFSLNFYLHNVGNANAKNTLLTMEFNGVEIKEIQEGKLIRIDQHRGNKPSAQLDLLERVIHPRKETRNVYIGKILFKLTGVKEGVSVEYDLVADTMKFFKDIYRIRPKSSNTEV